MKKIKITYEEIVGSYPNYVVYKLIEEGAPIRITRTNLLDCSPFGFADYEVYGHFEMWQDMLGNHFYSFYDMRT